MISLFSLLIAVILVGFAIDRFLDVLQYRSLSSSLPSELESIYSPDQYRESQEYGRATSRFGFVTSVYSLFLTLAMLFFDGFAWGDHFIRGWGSGELLVSLFFFGALFMGSEILGLPFAYYSTFVIEERFGFNKSTLATFISDRLKGWLLALVFGGGILGLIVWFYSLSGTRFWIWAWLIITGFSIFITMFYSTLIVPLFNKQQPLEEGDLRSAISEFAEKSGFQLDNIFVIDGSKRSTKANAYFSGLGPKKRIVLYDTLINDLEIDELVAVLAHEIGHYKKKHVFQMLSISTVQTGIMLYVFSLLVAYQPLSEVLGARQHSFHLAMITFAILYSPLSMVVGVAVNGLSRKNEYQADRFAADFGLAEPLSSGLKKLSRNNLSNLTPHPAYVFVHYSHPPLSSRLRALAVQ